MKDDRPVLYTIGHSIHEWSTFVGLLHQHSLDAVADVRSSPYSQHVPQFNRDRMVRLLKDVGIDYVYLGLELGARRTEPFCYVNGKVDFSLVSRSELFLSGMERLRKGAQIMKVAIMCSEKDPITCHRTILVARYGANLFKDVYHILENGSVETRSEAEHRLMVEYELDEEDLFDDESSRLEEAYNRRSHEIAYKEAEMDDSHE